MYHLIARQTTIQYIIIHDKDKNNRVPKSKILIGSVILIIHIII